MGKHHYKTHGICPKQIDVDLDSRVIKKVKFYGGCQGNTRAIEKIVRGMNAKDVIESFEGIDCNSRGTSCPDQLAKALKKALEEEKK
ncbi:MAG: TIGR03905 family TSCPD domain-containing protein [Oscillospiraceae bacterium]|jgi:uncharacterized protein (TIGR03905 family)|nr:TIGR03905 family TSCPD domain-containing protein [Oscillospiraceae bacterium]